MTLTQLPGVPYAAPPRTAAVAGALAQPPRLVVIHDTSNTASASAEASYAATRTDAQSNWTSAHFYVDAGGALGSSPLDIEVWAAYSYANQHGWHIEMCGYNAGEPNAVPAGTIELTAALTARLCAESGIPVVHLGPSDVAAGKSGICGHWDITQGLNVGDHDDPGPAFDWPHFIYLVNQGSEDMTPEEHTFLKDLHDRSNWEVSDPPAQAATGGVPLPGSMLQLLDHLVRNVPSSGGGLSDADRALIQEDIDATTANTAAANALKASVDALAHQLSSP